MYHSRISTSRREGSRLRLMSALEVDLGKRFGRRRRIETAREEEGEETSSAEAKAIAEEEEKLREKYVEESAREYQKEFEGDGGADADAPPSPSGEPKKIRRESIRKALRATPPPPPPPPPLPLPVPSCSTVVQDASSTTPIYSLFPSEVENAKSAAERRGREIDQRSTEGRSGERDALPPPEWRFRGGGGGADGFLNAPPAPAGGYFHPPSVPLSYADAGLYGYQVQQPSPVRQPTTFYCRCEGIFTCCHCGRSDSSRPPPKADFGYGNPVFHGSRRRHPPESDRVAQGEDQLFARSAAHYSPLARYGGGGGGCGAH